MRILESIISDRGSKHAVSGGACRSAEEARAFVAELKRYKKLAKATHNSWALLCTEGPLKSDTREASASSARSAGGGSCSPRTRTGAMAGDQGQ
jgi:putative IMPACT (imprinted ancient) family translation regulator